MTYAERVRLATLDPRWWQDRDRFGQGVSFLCPHCKQQRIVVAFDNPLDGDARSSVVKIFHHRSGENFETLTIRPVIEAARPGHWIGHVTDGMVHP